MKRFLSILLSCPVLAFCQLSDDFESGNLPQWDQFPQNRWHCSDIDPLQGLFSLRHQYDNNESGVDRISFSMDDLDLRKAVRWEFLVKYEYNPSSTNNWNIFLLADKPAEFMEKDSGIKALILGVNYTGSDDFVCLYKQDETGILTLLTTSLNWQNLNDQDVYRFIVNYQDDQHFTIEGGMDTMALIGTTESIDPGFEWASFFGIRYSYTSSKDMLLSIDEVSVLGTSLSDTLAPEWESLEFLNRNTLKVQFSEDVYFSDDFNILINNQIQTDSIKLIGNSILLFYHDDFVNHHEYDIFISGLTDKKSNEFRGSWEFVFFIPGRGDVKISEIMADPTPVVYLPDYEFIELYNNSSENMNLENWEISIGSKQILLPEIMLRKNEYCLITHPDARFEQLSYPVFNSIYSIPNEGCKIILKNAINEFIDGLDFSVTWHEDVYKQEGGWSLERIDLSTDCCERENWASSISGSGGTPMDKNSVLTMNPHVLPLFLSNTSYCGGTDFKLNFNRQATGMDLVNPQKYRLISGKGHVLNVQSMEPFRQNYLLHFDETAGVDIIDMLFDGTIEDCYGSEYLMLDTLKFGIPQKVSPLDILITEVLFDANPAGAEYIEIYNRSDKVLNLNELTLQTGALDESTSGGKLLCTDSILFFPEEYLVLTRYPGNLINYFNSSLYSRFFLFSELPALNNSEGRISIKDRSGQIIDEMAYRNTDHFPLLTTEKGASLERLELLPLSGLSAKWHTASSLVNFGTPGYQNSQFTGVIQIGSKLLWEKEFFTPNNDGIDDVAILNYTTEMEGVLGSVIVFDASGRIINTLYQQELLGTRGKFYWDGRNNEGRICRTGLYLFFIELIHLDGYKESFKKTVSLVHPIH